MRNREQIKEIALYIFAGGLTTAVNFVVFWLFSTLFSGRFFVSGQDVGYLAANTVAWVAAVLFAFVVNKFFVFGSKDTGRAVVVKEFGLFVSARVFSFLLEQGILIAAVSLMGFHELIAKAVAAVAVVITNYGLSKKLIFKERSR